MIYHWGEPSPPPPPLSSSLPADEKRHLGNPDFSLPLSTYYSSPFPFHSFQPNPPTLCFRLLLQLFLLSLHHFSRLSGQQTSFFKLDFLSICCSLSATNWWLKGGKRDKQVFIRRTISASPFFWVSFRRPNWVT